MSLLFWKNSKDRKYTQRVNGICFYISYSNLMTLQFHNYVVLTNSHRHAKGQNCINLKEALN